MKVLGIDIGTAITGWSVVENIGSNYKVFDYGVIKTTPDFLMSERLRVIFESINEIITKFKPNVVAVEDLFYFKNQKTVIKVGQARGVVLLAGALAGLEVIDFTPLQIKQAVTGYGRAEKKQVQEMVRMILSLKEIPKPDDAADALAVSICYLNSSKNIR